MNRKVSFDAIIRLRKQLTDDELRVLVTNIRQVKNFLARLVATAAKNVFVEYIDDKDVPERLQPVLAKWRRYATELGYSGPVAWRVKAGFTLKRHAPLAGPCHERFNYLQDWRFADEPTVSGIVFWVPRLAPETTAKNVEEQTKVIMDLRTRFELPEHHLKDFGSAGLVAALIFAHFKRTGERVPLDLRYVRTATRHSDGCLLNLGDFDEQGLGCGGWWGGGRGGGLGVFALGVDLEPSDAQP